jgi:hypothetical protein
VTVRVVVAVALAVALLATVGPGVQVARERATVSAVDADLQRVRAAVAAMADAPRGSRRVVDVSLPASTIGTARVAELRISERAVRYRLASGRRAGTTLPVPVTPTTSASAVDATAAPGSVVVDAPGTYRVVVWATARGVVVALAGDGVAAGGEGSLPGARRASACSTDPGTVRVRRPSTTGCFASTRRTATATAPSGASRRVAGPSSTRANLVQSTA